MSGSDFDLTASLASPTQAPAARLSTTSSRPAGLFSASAFVADASRFSLPLALKGGSGSGAVSGGGAPRTRVAGGGAAAVRGARGGPGAGDTTREEAQARIRESSNTLAPFTATPSLRLIKAALGLSATEAKDVDEIAEAVGIGGGRASATPAAESLSESSNGPSIAKTLEIVRTLVTGEDAISFFLSLGEKSPIKFLYLVRRFDVTDWRLPFEPYNLIVTSKEAAEKRGDYFTVTARGITHFAPGEPAEFSTTMEFMRDAAAFSVITRMSFYRLFLRRKAFRSWRASVNFNRYARARNATRTKLFSWIPTFSGTFAQITTVLAKIETAVVVSAPNSRYTAESLSEEQLVVRTAAGKVWEASVNSIIGLVEAVVTDVKRRAHDTGDAGFIADASASKSMAAMKANAQARAAAVRVALVEEALLPLFIRRVDFMVCETVARVVETSFAQLRAEIEAGDQRAGAAGAMLQTTVRFVPGPTPDSPALTVFEPSLNEFLGTIDLIASESIKVAAGMPRVLLARMLRGVVSAASLPSDAPSDQSSDAPQSSRAGPSAGDLLEMSARLAESRAAIEARLRADFAAVDAFAVIFDNVKPIFENSISFDWDAFSAEHNTTTLQREMSRLRNGAAAIDRMRTQQTCGSLLMESKKLRAELEPITTTGLQRLKNLLIESTRTKCKYCQDSFLARSRQLSQAPTVLDKFAAFVERRNAIRETEQPLLLDLASVEDLYRLLSAYDVKISSDDAVALDDVRNANAAYLDAQRAANMYIDDKLPNFSEQLESNILRANESLKSLAESVNVGVFIDPDTPPADTLVELQAAHGRFVNLKTMSEMYARWQLLFGVSTESKENKFLKDTAKAVETRLNLWKGLAAWDAKSGGWMTAPFAGLDIEELTRDVQVNVKAAYSMDKALHDGVSALYKSRVVAFRAYVGVISDLGNKNIRERHWKRLYEERGVDISTVTAERTLADLLEMKIYEVPDLCSEISGVASGEAQLEAQINKIELAWASTSFTTKNYREQRGVYILTALDDIITQLEDHQVTLQTMLGSRFIAGVRDSVETWDKKLAMLSETLDEWLMCQRQWMYLETIFSAEDIQRQLPVEAQKFFSVDRQWKDIMAKTTSRPLVLNAVEQGDTYFEIFKKSNVILEQIQKALEEYLETKRSGFPRFYFLSNDELLAILAQSRDPTAVQPHLQK